MGTQKSLAIIPARGGSKGLRRKNLRLLGGKPLLAYAIEVTMAAGCYDRIVVSTEDEEIAAVACEYGASVPFMRPRNLAGDKASLNSVIEDVLDRCRTEGFFPDVVGTILPTSPFRTAKMVREMTRACMQGSYRVASTVRLVDQTAIYTQAGDGDAYVPLRDENKIIPGAYCRTYGALQVWRLVSNLLAEEIYIHVLQHPAEWVDIDTNADLQLAERIIERGLYRFDYE